MEITPIHPIFGLLYLFLRVLWPFWIIENDTPCCRADKYTNPANLLNISDWQRTRQEWQSKWLLLRPNFIMANRKNRNSVRRTVTVAGRWSLVQDLVLDWRVGARLVVVGLVVTGAGLESWCKTGSRWIGGHWCRTGNCCYRTGNCCCRKVVAGAGLLVAGVGLVAAGAGLVDAAAGK